ncbi:creatininase [Youhaiella tibetensis]|uniref:Creatininase family protein n=1 Tax=Paradevosia tibetensis TaxID=1447062 RepID=A0A5B9DLP5_9HYPH|nr:creatininase family protein [Youhaiella tibetensis]QEE19589.1 creatininase family protein [Youhaiella tibetensis]GGF31750.1 creatininase [Youhaiella tibetensis]
MRKIWWTDFAAREFDGIDPNKTIAILPIAAVEQHGPHLPVGTDTIINTSMMELLAERAPENLDIRILPVQSIGKSNEHVWANGTITHTATNLIEAWTQIGLEVARAGVRKIVIVNSHGGNEEIMGIVARELRVRAGMLAVKSGWRFTPPDVLTDLERRHGIHGGDAETSLILHFKPHLVDMARAENFVSIAARDEQQFRYLRPTGAFGHVYAWIASDINPAGAVGDASIATAEKGRTIAEANVAGMLEVLAEVERMPLPSER